MKFFEKKFTDEEFKVYRGKNFRESWYTTIVDSNEDGYYTSEGKNKVLFKFRKNQIKNELSELAINTFLNYSKKKHSNRGSAGGLGENGKARHFTQTGQNEGNYIASNISGYFDRPLREHRGILGTIKACRTTAFTLNNMDLWVQGLPFIQFCSKLFKKYCPKEYQIQKREYNLINNSLKIPKSVFTTLTSNYNWKTACHQDSGDFHNGLGNLTVLGKDFEGGYLGFPQFKVLIKIKPGDILFMNSREYHCNTSIKTHKDGYRLSFVMYIREDMKFCKKAKKIENVNYFI
jgi:hypothetical protein